MVRDMDNRSSIAVFASSFAVTALLCLGFAATASAQATCEVPFAAYLTDTDGEPVPGPIDIELRFYEVAEGGDPVACRTFAGDDAVDVDEGWFRVPLDVCLGPELEEDALCGTVPLNELFEQAERDGTSLYVGLRIDGEVAELTPRIALGSTPRSVVARFAQQARLAEEASNLGDLAPEDVFRADGSVPLSGNLDLGGNEITNTSGVTIGDGGVNDMELRPGEIRFGDGADQTLETAEVQTLTGGPDRDADGLHTHAGASAGGAGCFTGYGIATCPDGYAEWYQGRIWYPLVWNDQAQAEVVSAQAGVCSAPLPETEVVSNVYNTNMYRVVEYRTGLTHVTGGMPGGMWDAYQQYFQDMPCVVCCR